MWDKRKSGECAAQMRPHLVRMNELLDEALIETFPASDPVSIGVDAPKRPVSVEAHADEDNAVKSRLEYWKAPPDGIAAFRRFSIAVWSARCWSS